MTQNDLPNLRRLAAKNQIVYSGHAIKKMLERGISRSDVINVLTSPTNQLIEVQPPSNTPGKEHKDERDLISDPEYEDDIIVVLAISLRPVTNIPEIVIVTAEHAKDGDWSTHDGKDPWLIRNKPK